MVRKLQNELINYIEEQHEEMVSFWERLVNIDSGSEAKNNIDYIISILEKEFNDIDYSSKVFKYEKAGNALVSKTEDCNEGKVTLLGHADTVFPEGTTNTRPFFADGIIAKGPGVLDMKGGLVQILYACKALKYIGCKKNITVIIAGDEEVGHKYSNVPDIIMKEAAGSVAAFCCESGRMDGNVVIERKGVGNVYITAIGKESHAGDMNIESTNAINGLLNRLIKIQDLGDNKIYINIGTIKGGSAVNVVAGKAVAELDVRFSDTASYNNTLNKIVDIAENTHGNDAKCYVLNRIKYPPMKMNKSNIKLYEVVRKINDELRLDDIGWSSVGGAADSVYTSTLGIPTICGMGPKGAYQHSPREFAYIDSLIERTKLLATCMVKSDKFNLWEGDK